MRGHRFLVVASHRLRRLACAALCWAAGSAALADPGYYVVTVYDNEGRSSIDVRYWTVKFPQTPEVIWPEVGFGHGVTSRWTTELFASWIGSSQFATRLSTWNWQNDFLLTQGELPLDIALHAQLIRNQLDNGGRALEYGLVLQTDVGRTQLNGNVFFERGWGGLDSGATQLKYQWQLRYRWKPGLHVGAQGFAQLGHLVDERDLRRQEGVRRVLDHLRRDHTGDQDRSLDQVQRAVQVAQDRGAVHSGWIAVLPALDLQGQTLDLPEIERRSHPAERSGEHRESRGRGAAEAGADGEVGFDAQGDPRFRLAEQAGRLA